jgi:type II secretory pathway component PulJ
MIPRPAHPASRRRAFTLVELLAAGVIIALIAGSVAVITQRLLRSRSGGGAAEAFARASVAADIIARDLQNVLRDEDPLQARVAIRPGGADDPAAARDQLLLRALPARPARAASPQNEGPAHTVHFRLEADPMERAGLALWRRADPFPNTNQEGGGLAAPVAPGLVGLRFEATDGKSWFPRWDSDLDGYPHAVRIVVTATDSLAERTASVRRTIAIDRVPLPLDVSGAENTDPTSTTTTGGRTTTGGAR